MCGRKTLSKDITSIIEEMNIDNKTGYAAEYCNTKSLAKSISPKTLVFDEVDSGVSGATADKVGARLFELSIVTSIFLPFTKTLGFGPLKSTSTSYFFPSISNKYFFIKPLLI